MSEANSIYKCLTFNGKNFEKSQSYFLLKGYDERGFFMYTKRQGHDSEGEVAANSDIFLTFSWMGPVEKEVKVYGTLEKIGSQEMEHFF
jgi:pyridoxine/pyridoxamine 5'-phosphate oxidase